MDVQKKIFQQYFSSFENSNQNTKLQGHDLFLNVPFVF